MDKLGNICRNHWKEPGGVLPLNSDGVLVGKFRERP